MTHTLEVVVLSPLYIIGACLVGGWLNRRFHRPSPPRRHLRQFDSPSTTPKEPR